MNTIMRKGILKRSLHVTFFVGLLFLMGCGDDPQQLFETAQFEEQQNNQEHARQLYKQILENSPDSDYATKAQERLSALTLSTEE